MNNGKKDVLTPAVNGKKTTLSSYPGISTMQPGRSGSNGSNGNGEIGLDKVKAAIADIERMRLGAQRELEIARHIRAEAERYQQGMETRARSQAQMLILQTRLSAKKELSDLRRELNEELRKVLADIRIMIQDDLKTQRRFIDAARIRDLSRTFQEEVARASESREEAVKETVKV